MWLSYTLKIGQCSLNGIFYCKLNTAVLTDHWTWQASNCTNHTIHITHHAYFAHWKLYIAVHNRLGITHCTVISSIISTAICPTHRIHLSSFLAYFPAVFFHICNFDMCHEIQHAVVTPYRAYQNGCSSFLGWNSRSRKLCFLALRTPIKEAKKRKSIRI